MHPRWSVAVMIIVVGLCRTAYCQGFPAADDKAAAIAADLDAAKEGYKEEKEKLKKRLIEVLDKAEAAAEKKGKADLLDKIVEEKKAFEASDALPNVISTTAYVMGVRRVRAQLEAAYEEAAKKYLKEKMRAEYEAIQVEKKRFIEEELNSLGVFEGAAWDGSKTWYGGAWKRGEKQNMSLLITSVDGRTFKGKFGYGNAPGRPASDHVIPIMGSVRNNMIEWIGDGVPLPRYQASLMGRTLRGDFNNGLIVMTR